MTEALLAELWLKSIVFAAVGLTVSLIVARRSPTRRCVVWTAVAGGLLVLPISIAVGPELPVAGRLARPAVLGFDSHRAGGPLLDRREVVVSDAAATQRSGPSTVNRNGIMSITLFLRDVAPYIWFVGLVAFACAVVRANWLVLRHHARSRKCDDDRLNRFLRTCAECVGLDRLPELKIGSPHTAPFTAGWLRPWICIPEDALRWDDDELQAIIAHECCHIRLRHFFSRWLAEMSFAFNWLNPLAWIVLRRHVRDQELACDDLSLASGIDPVLYAEAIVNAARRGCARVRAPAMSHRCSLHRRLRRILDNRGGAPSWPPRVVTLGLLTVVGSSAVLGGLTFALPHDDQGAVQAPPSALHLVADPHALRAKLPPLKGVRALAVFVHSGSVNVLPSATDQTEVLVRVAHLSLDGPTMFVDDPQPHLSLRREEHQIILRDRHADNPDRDRWRVDVEIRLAADIAIDARSRLGDVMIAAADESVFASSGEANVTVDLANTVLDRLTAHSGEGRVWARARGVRDSVDLSVGAGSIDAAILQIAPHEKLTLEGGEASIDVRLPADTPCVLEGSMGEGTVHISESSTTPSYERLIEGGGFRVVVRGVERPRYRFECGEGHINVRFVE